MKRVSREVSRKGMVRIAYDQLEAMKPAVAALERSGWDIRYKVDDLTLTKEMYLEHPMFDESEEYREYQLRVDGTLWKRSEDREAKLEAKSQLRAASEYQPWPDTMRGIERR